MIKMIKTNVVKQNMCHVISNSFIKRSWQTLLTINISISNPIKYQWSTTTSRTTPKAATHRWTTPKKIVVRISIWGARVGRDGRCGYWRAGYPWCYIYRIWDSWKRESRALLERGVRFKFLLFDCDIFTFVILKNSLKKIDLFQFFYKRFKKIS